MWFLGSVETGTCSRFISLSPQELRFWTLATWHVGNDSNSRHCNLVTPLPSRQATRRHCSSTISTNRIKVVYLTYPQHTVDCLPVWYTITPAYTILFRWEYTGTRQPGNNDDRQHRDLVAHLGCRRCCSAIWLCLYLALWIQSVLIAELRGIEDAECRGGLALQL